LAATPTDQVEQVAGVALADRDGARGELTRHQFGGQELDYGQRKPREHGQPPEQFHLLTRRRQGRVEPDEAPDVGQREDGQAAAQHGQRPAHAEGVQKRGCGDRSGTEPALGREFGRTENPAATARGRGAGS